MPEVSDAPTTLKKKRTLGTSASCLRRPLGATFFTVLVVGLVALALVGMRSWWFIGSLLAIVIAATAFFHVIFSGTRFFAVAFQLAGRLRVHL
jgi:hypothetical protein